MGWLARYKDACPPGEEDTLILVFSATKGLASMTLAVAHSRGLVDYEERVSEAIGPNLPSKAKKRSRCANFYPTRRDCA